MDDDLSAINRAIAKHLLGDLNAQQEHFLRLKNTCLGRFALDQNHLAQLLASESHAAPTDLPVVYLNRDYLRFCKLVATQALGGAPYRLMVVGMSMATARMLAALAEADIKKVAGRAGRLVFECDCRPLEVVESFDPRRTALLAMLTS